MMQPDPMKVVVSRPALWERLAGAARVTLVSAPPGSGKTVLLRSWISEAGLAKRAAWVPAPMRGEDQLGRGAARRGTGLPECFR
jgi:ATP/maltotriose-dependent transcriptional regulator MalT